MKNTKIMAVLVVLLAAALFIGAASADPAGYVSVTDTAAGAPTLTIPSEGNTNEYGLNYTAMIDRTGNLTGSQTLSVGTQMIYELKRVGGTQTLYVSNGNVTVRPTDIAGTYKGTLMFTSGTTYVLNVTGSSNVQDGKFTWNASYNSNAGAQMWNVTTGSSITPKMPNGNNIPVGTKFVLSGDTSKYLEVQADGSLKTQDGDSGVGNIVGFYATAPVGAGNSVDVFVNVVTSGSGGATDSSYYRNVSKGQDAFVFERINVTGATNNLTMFTDGQNPTVVNQIAGNNGHFYLTESVVGGHYGKYTIGDNSSAPLGVIYIWYPEISLEAELATSAGDSVDGKTINKNTEVNFLINSPKVAPAFFNQTSASPLKYNQAATAKVVFTTPVAGKTTTFGTVSFASIDLTSTQTGKTASPTEDATAGTYTAQAEYIKFDVLNTTTGTLVQSGYSVFADYAKKSNTVSFTVQSSTLTITAAKDTVVRSNPFTVTISGDSKAIYKVFLDGASETEINPTLQDGQSGYQSSGTTSNDVIFPINGVDYKVGGNFETDASGKRTIQYNTAANTEDKTYTIKVQGYNGDGYKDANIDPGNYDTVKVKVEKGAVTISASGDGSYYIGDEIKLTGTNTDSSLIYLFLTGQNLDDNGIVLKTLPNKYAAMYGNANPVAVKTDNTWEYKWDTSKIALDTGAYTIYATSRITNGKSSNDVTVATDATGTALPENYVAVKLSDSEYATVSVNLKQPFLSAVPSGTVVAKGDKIYIRGTAEGDPSTLQLYIFGPNFFEDHSITVEDDGTYEKKIEIPSSMSSNQYFVVVQHPMYNGAFDALLDKTTKAPEWYFHTSNVNTGGDSQAFVVWGSSNKLQGSQAADALTKMIDSANIDDIYTKLTFTVAEPWIRITNPGDQATGSKFTITGTTNLAVDDQILVEVMSSSFSAVDKTSTSTTSGVSQTTKVVAGEGTDNTWSVEVDTTNWKLDEYTIKVSGIEVDVTTTTNFNLVEKVVTPTPTATATGVTPTATATATATATPATPGFGAFIALAGLGAVALLVLRRN